LVDVMVETRVFVLAERKAVHWVASMVGSSAFSSAASSVAKRG